MDLLAFTPNLMTAARVVGTLEKAGHAIRSVGSADVVTALGTGRPDVIFVDIGAGSGWDWEAVLSGLGEVAPEVPVLAFGSHKDEEALRRARELGARRVVARSAFFERMVALAGALAGSRDS